MPAPADRRRSPRTPLRGDATLWVEGESLDGRLIDVGTGGLAILARRPSPDGFVHIRFRVSHDAGMFDVDGLVVRDESRDGMHVWGVRFCDLDLGTKTKLRNFVVGQLRLSA